MPTTYLVTGCAGLIGSHLCDYLLALPDAVVVGIDNLSGGLRDNVPAGVVFHQLDLATQLDAVSAVFAAANPRYVFHLAAYAAEGLSPFIRVYNYTNNVVAAAHLITQAIKHGVARFVFTSSMAVYGDAPAPFDEATPPAPIDPYGIAKFAVELDLKVAAAQHGLEYCILRPHNVVGERVNYTDPYRNVLAIWANQLLRGEPISVYGDGSQTRAFTYVGDITACLHAAAVAPAAKNATVNLGGIVPVTIRDAAEAFARLVAADGIEGRVAYLPARHEAKHAYTTWARSVALLGFEHKTSLDDILRKLWAWRKVQPARPLKVWDAYELDVGMYPFWTRAALGADT